MSKTAAKNGIILINGYNFSTYAMAFDALLDAGKVDVTGFGDASQNFIPGLPKATISIEMLWDSTASTGVHAIMSSRPTGVATILPEGYALGNPTISMPFMQGNYSPKGVPAEALKIGKIAFENYGATAKLENGWALAHGTITNTTTGTGYDDPTGGAVTAACSSALHVWTPTSTDTYVVKIQHSTTLGSGYADLITFTADGTARTVERQLVASGTINRYRRVLATRTGSAGDSFGFTVHFSHE